MSRDHEQEPNLYEARMRGWLAEYPYSLPTHDPSSPFTPEEIARALPEAVRREDGNALGLTCLPDRGSERVGSAVHEQSSVRIAEAAMRELRLDRVRENVGEFDPERLPRLRRRGAETDATTRLVVV